MTDIPGDNSTTASISVGGSVSDSLEIAGDHDRFRIDLNNGQEITIALNGITLTDPYLRVYDAAGNLIFENDDGGPGLNSRVSFAAPSTGTFFIDVGAWNDSVAGTYTLSVTPYTRPSPGTNDQIANYLAYGAWDGDAHHFDLSHGRTITVNISTLTPDEQRLATAALAEWADIIGVTFQQVTTGGQIVFDHSEDPSGPIAATDAVWANGITTSAHIQISTSWVLRYGTALDSYSFQTYVHEIGHALGLGHAGDYNGTARYPYEAVFQNDDWATSVMSYFDQHENSYFGNQGFSVDHVLTPMVADILAMQQLYGLSTSTRAGDTIYGYHSNAGDIYDPSIFPDAAYTIFDTGGTDTIDGSGSTINQIINLTPETFSNLAGQVGNVTIARGVVIENAIGGSGNDTIVQNSANNVLDGGNGDDTVSYETAGAGVRVNLGLTTQQDTLGAGLDTLSGFEHVVGSAYADLLIGGSSTRSLLGGAGDDRIEAGSAPAGLGMYGGDGNDLFILGNFGTWVDGGSGFNTADFSTLAAGTTIVTNGSGGLGVVTLVNIQKVIGSNYADEIFASNPGDTLIGGGGDDTLISAWGSCQLAGGTGNDTYKVSTATDNIIENVGEGTDTVIASLNFTLGANVENLTIAEYLQGDPYAGAALPSHTVEDWSATGNDLSNVIIGNAGINSITGRLGADMLTGGAGNDTFIDTLAGLNGDTITDFSAGDRIIITDADQGNFPFSLVGNTLTFAGGSLAFGSALSGRLIATAAAGGGVEIKLQPQSSSAPSNDFNGDGHSDMLLRNDDGTVVDWLGQPNGAFFNNGPSSSVDPGADWHIAGTGDFNGDGYADILWRNDIGSVVTLLGTPSGGFIGNVNFNLNPGLDWHIAGTGDFNGDGRDDILWRNDSGNVITLLGNANGSFTGNVNFQLNPGLDWHVAGTGDFNGDGRDDILWRNDIGTVVTLLGQANGSFVGNVNFLLNPGLDWHIAGTGDFNGDGFDDILWRNDIGNVVDLLGQANGSFIGNVNFQLNPGLDWHIVGTGDYNGDGFDDILWRNDAGTIIDLLGQPNGAFVGNVANFATNPGDHWHVEPAPGVL